MLHCTKYMISLPFQHWRDGNKTLFETPGIETAEVQPVKVPFAVLCNLYKSLCRSSAVNWTSSWWGAEWHLVSEPEITAKNCVDNLSWHNQLYSTILRLWSDIKFLKFFLKQYVYTTVRNVHRAKRNISITKCLMRLVNAMSFCYVFSMGLIHNWITRIRAEGSQVLFTIMLWCWE